MPGDNGRVVKEFLDAFAAGDVEGALARIADDGVIDEAHGMPFSGRYVGPSGFLALLGAMSESLDAKVDQVRVLDAGDVVAGHLELTFISKRSGRQVNTSAVELYTVVGDRITAADVYYKDPGAVSDLVSG